MHATPYPNRLLEHWQSCETEEQRRRLEIWNSNARWKIGPRHSGCRLSNFRPRCDKEHEALKLAEEMAANIGEHVWRGKDLLLYGPCGTGKDHLMVALLFEAVFRTGCTVDWRFGADLFADLRDRIDNGLPEAAFLKELAAPDVLAISDPVTAGESLTGFQKGFLLRVVDHRYRWKRGTWLTVNVANRPEAEQRLGVATMDRLMENRVAIFCDWPSYRLAQRDRRA